MLLKFDIGDDELDFLIKAALVLVATNYARVKKSAVTEELVKEVRKCFRKDFFGKDIESSNDVRAFVKKAALLINLRKPGFGLFAINLIIKRLAPFFKPECLQYLDAPLNADELKKVGSKVNGMSKVTFENYDEVMDTARAYAERNGEDSSDRSLYRWEIKEYNK